MANFFFFFKFWSGTEQPHNITVFFIVSTDSTYHWLPSIKKIFLFSELWPPKVWPTCNLSQSEGLVTSWWNKLWTWFFLFKFQIWNFNVGGLIKEIWPRQEGRPHYDAFSLPTLPPHVFQIGLARPTSRKRNRVSVSNLQVFSFLICSWTSTSTLNMKTKNPCHRVPPVGLEWPKNNLPHELADQHELPWL